MQAFHFSYHASMRALHFIIYEEAQNEKTTDIHPRTFYNWVHRLRQHPDFIIPERTEPKNGSGHKQDVVKVELTSADPQLLCHLLSALKEFPC